MKTLPIKAFRFLGGDRSDLKTERSLTGHEGWGDVVSKLAFSRPNVFPTHPYEIRPAVGNLSFVNVPIHGMPGYRAHCVYFKYTVTRAFWNVLCFAYREADCPLRTLASVSANDWYDICTRLTSDTDVLKIQVRADSGELIPPLPFCDPTQAIFYRFPTAQAEVKTCCVDEDWENTLVEFQKRPPMVLPEKGARTDRRGGGILKKNKKFSLTIFLCLATLFISAKVDLFSKISSRAESAKDVADQQAVAIEKAAPELIPSESEEIPTAPSETPSPSPAEDAADQRAVAIEGTAPEPIPSELAETPTAPSDAPSPSPAEDAADRQTVAIEGTAPESTPSELAETPTAPSDVPSPSPAEDAADQQTVDIEGTAPEPTPSEPAETPTAPSDAPSPSPAENAADQRAVAIEGTATELIPSESAETPTSPSDAPSPSPAEKEASGAAEESDTE